MRCCCLQKWWWRGISEPDRLLHSIKVTRQLSYIWSLNEQNQVTTRGQVFVPKWTHICCLSYCIWCAGVFSGFAQHSSFQCSCTLPLSPPRGCSHLFWILEQFLGCPAPQVIGDVLSMDIFPWRNDGCHSPRKYGCHSPGPARKCASSYTAWLHSSAVSCVVY